MTKREKILAAIVVTTLVVGGGLFAIDTVIGQFGKRDGRITNLTGDIGAKDLQLRRARVKARRLDTYKRQSLPDKVELAQAEYSSWLTELATEKVQLQHARIRVTGGGHRGKVYRRLSFSLLGRGDLEQVTELLYGFYETNYLHRISLFRMTPVQDSKDIDITMNVEALSLNPLEKDKKANNSQIEQKLDDKPANESEDPPPSRLQYGTLDDYVKTIVGRNPFRPPNAYPRFDRISSQRATLGETLRFTAKAEDPDKLDRLTYSIEGEDRGARINSRTGEFSWRPREPGEYTFAIKVTDDGFPAQSATHELRVRVSEKEEEKNDFDYANFAFVTGIVEESGKRRVWIWVRPTGQILKLASGDFVSVGSIKGKVMKLEIRSAEFLLDDSRLIVKVGQKLTEGVKTQLAKEVTMAGQ